MNELHYYLATLFLPTTTLRKIHQWLAHDKIEKLFHAEASQLKTASFTEKEINAIKQFDWRSISRELVWLEKENNHVILITDEDYPALLKEIHDPPLLLFVQGNQAALKETQIAMVGARQATPSGMRHAFEFAHDLAKENIAVTSGLALGIDAASHEGALKANGITIAVAGTGLSHVYPAKHKSLAASILEGKGAIVSEFPCDEQPKASNFPRRNRIISGLCVGVLVVEAALKSGSLITARFALEQSREVFAMPGSIKNALSRGCHKLIREGATLVETIDDIFSQLSFFRANTIKTCEKSMSLTLDDQQLLNQIDYEITSMDVILSRSQLTGMVISSMLLRLELEGYIQSVPGGYARI